MFVLRKPLIKKTENAYHVTILTFGILIQKNVPIVLLLMFMINKDENAYVLTILHMIQEYNASNAYNQVTGIKIKEDACNVPINKFMIELKDTVLLAHKMHHFLKITNAMPAHNILITIERE